MRDRAWTQNAAVDIRNNTTLGARGLSTNAPGLTARFKVFDIYIHIYALTVIAKTTWTTSCTHQDNDLQGWRACKVALSLRRSRVTPMFLHRSAAGSGCTGCAMPMHRCRRGMLSCWGLWAAIVDRSLYGLMPGFSCPPALHTRWPRTSRVYSNFSETGPRERMQTQQCRSPRATQSSVRV